MAGLCSRATWKIYLIFFSESPTNFETISAQLNGIKQESASVAHALANSVLPVPGGPYNNMPLHGFLAP